MQKPFKKISRKGNETWFYKNRPFHSADAAYAEYNKDVEFADAHFSRDELVSMVVNFLKENGATVQFWNQSVYLEMAGKVIRVSNHTASHIKSQRADVSYTFERPLPKSFSFTQVLEAGANG